MTEAAARITQGAMYERIGVRPIAGALGAEIEGVDIAAGVDDETFGEIHRVWLEYTVIYFRGQRMSPAHQIEFAQRFGDIHRHLFNKAMDDYPQITELLKMPTQEANAGGRWHSDQMYTSQPAKATMLQSIERPHSGGQTRFLNMRKAYADLPATDKQRVDGLCAVHCYDTRRAPARAVAPVLTDYSPEYQYQPITYRLVIN